ncbi:MAG TPA: hypothetical protein VGI70_16915, partial [Polyangiales bacterium]
MSRVSVLAIIASLAWPALASAEQVLPIVVHVAQRDGKPVADAQFIADRIARANEIYAPYQLRFAIAAQRALDETHARMET